MAIGTDHTKLQQRVAALILLAFMAGFVWLTIAMYNTDFTPKAMVTVRANRAGLQMRKGTVVKLRGVDVGKIASTHAMPDGTAEITLAMKPEMLANIPDNVKVSLKQLTAFGNKAVLMQTPAEPSATHLAAGDTIHATHVSVEANQLLNDLEGVLKTARPAEVDSALTAVAGAVDGRGAKLGETLATANGYLTKINRDMPTLKADFKKGADVMSVYADIMPNLMTTLSNVSDTGRTISTNAHQLRRVLTSVVAVGNSGGRFLALHGDQLAALLSRSKVTTKMLARYSPEYSCFLKASAWYDKRALKAFGGQYAGIHVLVPLEQGTGPYKNPQNLPNMAADYGPHCYGMPNYHGGPLPKAVTDWKDPSGPTPWPKTPQLNGTPLATQLFGPLANLSGTTK